MAEITTTTTEIPDGAKKPQDRKKPQIKKNEKRTLKVNGITLTVKGDVLDDFELLDELGRIDQGEGQLVPSVLRRLVGDSWNNVMDDLRDPDTGRVSVQDATDFLMAVFKEVSPNS